MKASPNGPCYGRDNKVVNDSTDRKVIAADPCSFCMPKSNQ